MNRVTSVSKNGATEASYTYDNYGALAKETRGNVVTEYSYWYTGNLEKIKKTVDGVTTEIDLRYDDVWRDRLIGVGDETIEYDPAAPGLPIEYYNGKSYSFGWDEQGNLDSAIAGIVPVTFGYDTSGLRQFKISRGVRHDYYYDGDRLIAETIGDDKYLLFHYDETDSIFAITYGYDNTEYTYQLLKNLQGDVVAILNYDNNIIATYEYDAWGNLLSIKNEYGNDITTSTGYFANINPIRYRSYYYDTETKFYYLQSRYYDPANCRFISMDEPTIATDPSTVTDKNLFAYCDNDPINRFDNGGRFWDTFLDLVSLTSSVAEVIVNPYSPSAWASLAADVVCTVVPGLTGGGAIVKTVAKSDDVIDTAKAIYKAADKSSDIRKATGSYEIVYKSGNTYVGKGGYKRAINSARRNANKYTDEVASISWKSAPNKRTAFIDEYKSMCKHGGPNNSIIINHTTKCGAPEESIIMRTMDHTTNMEDEVGEYEFNSSV